MTIVESARWCRVPRRRVKDSAKWMEQMLRLVSLGYSYLCVIPYECGGKTVQID
jgi:hypothetical protein